MIPHNLLHKAQYWNTSTLGGGIEVSAQQNITLLLGLTFWNRLFIKPTRLAQNSGEMEYPESPTLLHNFCLFLDFNWPIVCLVFYWI